METVTKRLYEAMFLIDSAKASDWGAAVEVIEKLLKRSRAEIVSIRKWDERKLAYEVNRQTRGTYVLTYFRVEGRRVPEIEKNVQLSDQIMRVLILSAEQMTQEDIEKDTPATKAEKSKLKQKAAAQAELADAEGPAARELPAAEVPEGEAAEEPVAAQLSEQAPDSDEAPEKSEQPPASERSAAPQDSGSRPQEPTVEETKPDQAVQANEDSEREGPSF
ncbi:MAG: 30S ribosomal protein S6 [Phycisphaerales bacterium]|nr:MAG: 30S ribosomal protein S6 [Phycisphaerales bacterium]